MPLILFYSSSTNTNYVKVTAIDTVLPYYNMGIILNSHVVDANNTTDYDIITYPSKIRVYQTNLTLISNNTITSDLKNNITNSSYGLTLNINNLLATTPNNMYSSLFTDSLLFVNDTNTTIYDSQYTPSSIWVNNKQPQVVNNPSSYILMAHNVMVASNIGTSSSWVNSPKVILTIPSAIINGVAFTCSWSISNAPAGSYIIMSGIDTTTKYSSGSGSYTLTGLVIGTNYVISATLYSANGSILNTTSNNYTLYTNQIAYTTPGTYSWVAPIGITYVSVVAVGGGGGGGGGGLGWKNDIPVIPGQSYTIVVGGAGDSSYFISTTIVTSAGGGRNGAGGWNGAGGGAGGRNGTIGTSFGGYGGAGGYSGNGGAGGDNGGAGFGGDGGAGGGGDGGSGNIYGGGGGGVGIFGQGLSGGGAGKRYGGGFGGSNGGAGGNGGSYGTGAGGIYGGGAGGGAGGGGAVRIIFINPLSNYPAGTIRAFPSTNTADM